MKRGNATALFNAAGSFNGVLGWIDAFARSEIDGKKELSILCAVITIWDGRYCAGRAPLFITTY